MARVIYLLTEMKNKKILDLKDRYETRTTFQHIFIQEWK